MKAFVFFLIAFDEPGPVDDGSDRQAGELDGVFDKNVGERKGVLAFLEHFLFLLVPALVVEHAFIHAQNQAMEKNAAVAAPGHTRFLGGVQHARLLRGHLNLDELTDAIVVSRDH